MKRKFITLKETPELKKGAILIEQCDDGTQGYEIKDRLFLKFEDQHTSSYSKLTVENQPDIFDEIEQVWLNKQQLEKLMKLVR